MLSWIHFVTNLLEYRDAFALFDKRGDGKIDSDQIGDVLRALNLNPTEADVKKIVNEVDPNGKSYIVNTTSLPVYKLCLVIFILAGS